MNNAEVVARVARIAREMNRDIVTPEQARERENVASLCMGPGLKPDMIISNMVRRCNPMPRYMLSPRIIWGFPVSFGRSRLTIRIGDSGNIISIWSG